MALGIKSIVKLETIKKERNESILSSPIGASFVEQTKLDIYRPLSAAAMGCCGSTRIKESNKNNHLNKISLLFFKNRFYCL